MHELSMGRRFPFTPVGCDSTLRLRVAVPRKRPWLAISTYACVVGDFHFIGSRAATQTPVGVPPTVPCLPPGLVRLQLTMLLTSMGFPPMLQSVGGGRCPLTPFSTSYCVQTETYLEFKTNIL
jgi:hypothetical protein